MADTQDYTKTVLIDVQLKSDQVKKDLPATIAEIDRLTAAQKKLTAEGKKATLEYVNNAQQLRNLKTEVRDTNKYIDNTSKAIYAQGNSIQQNRALLSLMTADYVKLSQKEGETAASTIKLGQNIAALTEKLKAQEKQIGQTYRNVGNYTDSIKDALTGLGGIIPGFSQFAAALQPITKIIGFATSKGGSTASAGSNNVGGLAQGFKNFVGFKTYEKEAETLTDKAVLATGAIQKLSNTTTEAGEAAIEAAEGGAKLETSTAAVAESAGAAEAGISGAGGASIAATGAFAGLAIAAYGVFKYMQNLDSLIDGSAQIWAGVKSAFYAIGESIRAGDWGGLITNMRAAYVEAAGLTDQLQNLEDAFIATDVHAAKAEATIQDLMLKMRNKRISPEEEQKYFDKIQDISTKNYNERKKNADEAYKIAVLEAANGAYLSKQELERLKKEGVDYAIQLENDDKIKVGSYKKIAEAQKAQIAAEEFYNSVRDRAQNRLDAKQMQAQAKAESEAAKSLAAQQKQRDAQLETENILKSSEARVLQNIYENYGDRVVAADTQYNNEILKLNKFLQKKLISEDVYNSARSQLVKEHENTIANIIEDFQTKDLQTYQQAQNGLINLHNQGIEDDTKRTIAGLKQKNIEANQEIDRQNEQAKKNVEALEKEIAQLTGKAQDEAKTRRENELISIQQNEEKRLLLAEQTEKAIAEARHKQMQDTVSTGDEAAVLMQKRVTNLFQNNSARNAEINATKDKYAFEISEAAKAGKSTVLLKQQEIDAVKSIEDKYRNERIEYAANAEQQIQQSVFDIISQGLQQGSEYRINQLEKQKNAELSNSNLTATQRKLINDKYQKQEDAEKRKAFYANQKLQAANVLINGAVAVSKTIAEMGFLPALPFVALTTALTALSVAKVLSAKPGFAQGGQYVSDGKGALLPGYSKTDNTNATLRSGEAVVVSEAMQNPWARNVVSRINEMFGGRSFSVPGHKPAFAFGGIYTDGGNANRYYSQPVYDSTALSNSIAYQLINNFPPIIVDVKDINNQQAIVAKTVNRVNL